jgi:hypothetical protein
LFEKESLAMPRSLLTLAMLLAVTVGPAAVSLPSLSITATAQDGVLAELYGSGVHAYFGNDYAKAYDLLSRAINGGLNDPRAYYFRGLTNIATGRPHEAQADFQAGAQIEALGVFGPAIGRSLVRVQGSQRMQLEQIRQQARLENQAEMAARAQRRYSEVQQAEAQVLREPPRPRPAPVIPGRRPAPVIAADAPSPFADDAMATGQPTVQSRDALEDANIDPFADDGAAPAARPPAAAPETDADPFGGAPQTDPFGGAPDADPFGSAPADGDPFGGDPFGS